MSTGRAVGARFRLQHTLLEKSSGRCEYANTLNMVSCVVGFVANENESV